MHKIITFIVLLFILELLVLIEVGSAIGGFNTLMALFVSTFVGVSLIKSRFKALVAQLQSGVFDVQMLFLPLSGFLFLFPGFISDIIALLLLIPSVQIKAKTYYSRRQESKRADDGYCGGKTIDGEFTVLNEENDREKLK